MFWICGVLLVCTPHSLFAEDAVPLCNLSYQTHQDKILSKLEFIEDRYVDYRWAEKKIRELYYNRLWRARKEMNNPLDRALRGKAKDEETRLMHQLRRYERKSSDASNDFMHAVDALKQTQTEANNICLKYSFMECLGVAYLPIFKQLEMVEAHFTQIFELERDYRKRVEQVAAGRNGLYPDDALESSDAHDEFYWRYSKDFEPEQFKEDVRMMDYLHEIHKNLTYHFKGDTCCVYCQE